MHIYAQNDFNLNVVSYTSFDERGNDCWGYVDENGLEYAIIGSRSATRIYSLEDPANPVERAVIPGSTSVWRDIKSFGDFIYVTADAGTDGLLIIDMGSAPETINHDFWRPELTMAGITDTLNMCHNLFIDDLGVCYLAGCRIPERDNRGVILLDIITDPWNPTVLGYETNAYAHDVYVQNDRMYTSDIYEGEFSVYDVTDKSDPIYLGGAETSSAFTHNAWVSDDGNTVFTTDEVSNAYVDAYDISDLANIKRLDIYQPEETAGRGVIPHNTHFLNDYLITSWYTDGIVITDAANPDNMVKVGSFDTFDGPDGGFNGCWGVYPYLPSGLIIASSFRNAGDDPNGGFYILNPTYQRAAYLNGQVSDSSTGNGINGVDVIITNAVNNPTLTDPNGNYKTGTANTGSYECLFSHPAYFDKTVSVDLNSGDLTILDVQLDPKPSVSVEGRVFDENEGETIPNAFVYITDNSNTYEVDVDENGEFKLDMLVGDYQMIAGKWGFLYQSKDVSISSDSTVDFDLKVGYQDDFLFNYKWQVSGDAVAGIWDRGIPQGTFTFNNFAANPDGDADGDFGNLAFVTGNEGTEVDDDDVDGGETILRSLEMDLTTYQNPVFHFSYWFFDLGSGQPNDSLEVFISNGVDTVRIFKSDHVGSEWTRIQNLALDEALDVTEKMTIMIKTADETDSDHVVEAGFDAFLVTDGFLLNNDTPDDQAWKVSITPNPFNHYLDIEWNSGIEGKTILVNSMGQIVSKFEISEGQTRYQINGNYETGLYYLVITNRSGQVYSKKLIKI